MFKVLKTIQASGVLIRADQAHGMNYMRLLKLLYIADRESLARCGRAITGDRVVAMKRGPVLSNALNLIKGEHQDSHLWQKYFEKKDYCVQAVDNPDISELSKFEIRLLQEIAERYRSCDEWDMVEVTHGFEEWKKNFRENTATSIPLEDVLDAVGRAADKQAIIAESHTCEAFDQFFAQT